METTFDGDLAEFFGAVHEAGVSAGQQKLENQTRVTFHEFEGRKYIKEGTAQMREVKAPRSILRLPAFGAVADFAQGIIDHVKAPSVIMVNRTGAICYMRPECPPDEQDTISFAPFVASLPTEDKLTYPAFIELLDKFTGVVREEADLRAALKIMKAVRLAATKFEDRGAYTHITLEAGANVQAGEMDIPKAIQFAVPYGDPGYTMRLLYRLTIVVEGDALVFRLSAMPNVDKRDEQFVVQAIADLREALKDTQHQVYRAA